MLLRNKKLTDADIVARIEEKMCEIRGARSQLEEQIEWCEQHAPTHDTLKYAYRSALSNMCSLYDQLAELIM